MLKTAAIMEGKIVPAAAVLRCILATSWPHEGGHARKVCQTSQSLDCAYAPLLSARVLPSSPAAAIPGNDVALRGDRRRPDLDCAGLYSCIAPKEKCEGRTPARGCASAPRTDGRQRRQFSSIGQGTDRHGECNTAACTAYCDSRGRGCLKQHQGANRP